MSMEFNRRFSASVLASAAAAAFLAASPASATLIQTQGPVAVSGSDSVTATQSGVGTSTASKTNSTFATKSFSQFDTTNGVLTGAKVTVTGNRSETATLNASGGAKNAREAYGSATGTNTAITAPGISQSLGNVSVGSFKCQPDGLTCPRTVGSGSTPASGSASTNNLNAYVGNGNVSVNVSGDLGATAEIKGTPTTGGNSPYTLATLQNTVTWSGTMSLEYDYLAHANPSFSAITDQNVLNIDFGTVLQGSNPTSQTFSLSNLFSTLSASDTVGLDLDIIDGPNSPFSLTGSTFSNLLAGLTSGLFTVDFNTSNTGTFTDQILLSLSDADAGVGMATYSLLVNLQGLVEALPPEPQTVTPDTSVPEPASLALLATGLLAMGRFGSRKRRKTC